MARSEFDAERNRFRHIRRWRETESALRGLAYVALLAGAVIIAERLLIGPTAELLRAIARVVGQ